MMVNSRSLKRKIILERIELAISSDIALISVLCLAAILRVGHIFSLHSLPLFDRLIIDSEMYDKWAQMIAAGHWLGGYTAFYMDPLYSYVLAILYRIFGHDLLVVRLFQAGLGVATCALVGILGRRVGGKLVGTLAALFIALYRPSIFQEGEIEKTALGWSDCENGRLWQIEPNVGRVVNGVPSRVDRLKALGNAIVPQVAYQIFKAIEEFDKTN